MIQMFVPGKTEYWARFASTGTQAVTSGNLNSSGKMSFGAVQKSDNWPAVTLPVTDIVIPVTGVWLIIPHDLDWGDSSTGAGAGSRRLGMRINDNVSSIRQGAISAPTLSASAIQTVQGWGTIRPLTANATIQIYGIQTSGSTLNAALNDLGLYLLAPLANNPLADTDS